MSTGRNTQASSFLTAASTLGLQGLSVQKRKQILSNWVSCNEWNLCYPDFVVATRHSGGRDSIGN